MPETLDDRLARQIVFILEIDKLKRVLRQTLVTDRSRQENTAEHSWHLAMMAVVLADQAAPGVDVGHVIKLLLVHDLVEIDAGDTFLYDRVAEADKAARETAAAARIFALLPPGQGGALEALWREFESGTTREALFARALDQLQPVLLNHATAGGSWSAHGIEGADVLARKRVIADGAPALWRLAEQLIRDSIAKGWLR
jgi:putative hydrolase of HD superfamily